MSAAPVCKRWSAAAREWQGCGLRGSAGCVCQLRGYRWRSSTRAAGRAGATLASCRKPMDAFGKGAATGRAPTWCRLSGGWRRRRRGRSRRGPAGKCCRIGRLHGHLHRTGQTRAAGRVPSHTPLTSMGRESLGSQMPAAAMAGLRIWRRQHAAARSNKQLRRGTHEVSRLRC